MAKAALGEVIGGKYRIDEVLDPGPPTSTCRATRMSDDVAVSLKLLNSVLAGDREHRGRFQREAEVLGKIRHQAVPALLEQSAEGNDLYVVMEMCAGETLAARLARQGSLPIEHAITYLDWLLDLLEILHENQVVHRDLNPKNLVFAPSPTGVEILRVTDFRSARIGGEEEQKSQALTRFGATLGTPEYQAPEQIAGGKVDGRTDLYQLGCVAYAMITGQPPFTGHAAHEVMAKQVKEEPAAPSKRRADLEIPPGLEAWILKMLRKPIEQRFAGAKTAREMLHQALRDGKLPGAEPAPAPAAPAPAPSPAAQAPIAQAMVSRAAPGMGAMMAATRAAPAAEVPRTSAIQQRNQMGSARKEPEKAGVPWAIVLPALAAVVAAGIYLALRMR